MARRIQTDILVLHFMAGKALSSLQWTHRPLSSLNFKAEGPSLKPSLAHPRYRLFEAEQKEMKPTSCT